MEIKLLRKISFGLIAVIAILIIFNQWQISSISKSITGFAIAARPNIGYNKDVSDVNLLELKSTAHSVALLLPVGNIKTAEDAVSVMIPAGMPDYGADLGVSYDDPVNSLGVLARKIYPYMMQEIKKDDMAYQRYLNIVTKPVGISCEYCCGLQAIGVRKDGSSSCGCQHNPALLALTMWLVKYTQYTDAEIIREALKWKALFFPKKMVEVGLSVAGGDTSKLKELPGMVGGC